MGYKMGQKFFPRGNTPRPRRGLSMSALTWAYRPKPPLHGLSLNKSPIKNSATLFELGWVVKLDQTKLGFTKPNISHLRIFLVNKIFNIYLFCFLSKTRFLFWKGTLTTYMRNVATRSH